MESAMFARLALYSFSCLTLLTALSGCMSAHQPLSMPDASVVGFDGTHAVPPDCAKLQQPSHLVDAGSGRPGVAFGCATYTNLANMLARPADLVQPIPYAGADAAIGASAAHHYEDGTAAPLNSTSTTTTLTH
jgi:type IV pilus biogenesis protein CpaD/CtpE